MPGGVARVALLAQAIGLVEGEEGTVGDRSLRVLRVYPERSVPFGKYWLGVCAFC